MISRKTLPGNFCVTWLAALTLLPLAASAADSAVQLRIALTGAPGRRAMELSWNSQTGAVYKLQHRQTLDLAHPWQDFDVIQATGALSRVTLDGDPLKEEAHFREVSGFFQLVLPQAAIFSVEPALFPLGGPTEMYITGQCFGPGIEVRVGSVTLDQEIVHPGLIRATFTPQVPGSYQFDLVKAGSVLSSFTVHCYDPLAPPPSALQEPPDEPLASPVAKSATDKSLGINVTLAPDWSLGGAQGLKVKEKGNRTKCTSNLRVTPSGEVALDEVDLFIPGRGLDFIWGRRYLSRSGPNTEQGNRWDCSYNVRVQRSPGGMEVRDGMGRAMELEENELGFGRDMLFCVGTLTGGVFRLTFADTGYWEFHPLDGSATSGRLARIVDRNGNTLRLDYDAMGQLVRVIDTLDRAITIAYGRDGKIASVTDFIGRRVSYVYYGPGESGGTEGDLKSVTSPPVTGTPHKNDFPDGKTTTYTYSQGFADPRENSLLLTVTQPDLKITHKHVYQHNQTDLEFLRCISRQVGNSNQVITYSYIPQRPTPANRFAAMKVIVNDRIGNVSECSFDARHRLLLHRDFTGRAVPGVRVSETANRPTGKLRVDDPEYFETSFEWNNDSLCTRIIHPRGNVTETVYQRAFNQNDSRSNRRHNGDIRILRERACCSGADTNGDGLDDAMQLTLRFEHDTRFGAATSCDFPQDGRMGVVESARIIQDKETGRSKGFGFIISSTDPLGNISTASYDPSGNLLRTETTERKNGAIIAYDFNYNLYGQVTSLTHPADGAGCRRVDTFEYYDTPGAAGFGRLKKAIRDDGNVFCGETDHFRLATSYEYDAAGNVTRCVDPGSNDWIFTYNALDQMVARQTPSMSFGTLVRCATQFTYDANNNLVRVDTENRDHTGALDPANPMWTTDYSYNESGGLALECVEIAHEGLKACTSYDYDANDNLVLIRSPEAVAGRDPNAITRFDYDERDLLFREMPAPGTGLSTVDTLDYDQNGNCRKVSKVDAFAIKMKTVAFDGFDRPVRVTDAMGNVETSSFDLNGNLVHRRLDGETTDVSGSAGNVRLSETRYDYDSQNRLLRFRPAFFDIFTQAPIGDGEATTSFSYAPNGQLLSETDDNGHTTRYVYDSASRLLRMVDPKTNTVVYAYDATDNPTNVTSIERSDLGGEQRFSCSYEYDPRRRLVRATDNVGNSEQYFYDSRDNLVRRIDARGSLAGWSYDGLSRCTLAIADLDSDGLLDYAADVGSAQSWDDNSRLASSTDDNGNVTRYAYDALDRLVATTNADNTVQSLVWSPRSNLLRVTDPNGTVISNSYDLLDRCVRRDITPGPGVASTTTFESFDYDGESRLVRAANNGSAHTFVWDSCADLAGQSTAGLNVRSTYDGAGNRLSCTLPSGVGVQRSYDSLNQVATLSTMGAGGLTQHAAYSYDGPGRLARIMRPNGINTRINWSGQQNPPNQPGDFGWRQVARVNHARGGAAPMIVDQRVFAYDPSQNKTLRAQTTPFTTDGVTQTNVYALNKLHRLARGRTSRGPAVVDTEYQTDGMGNRQAVIENGVTMRYTMDNGTPEPADFQMNQYSFTPFGPRSYDRNGNQISIDGPAGATTFAYDYADRLVSVQRTVGPGLQPVSEYSYDALGRRISKTVFPPAPMSPVTTQFIYDGGQIVETREDGVVTAAYFYSLPEVDDEVLVAFMSGDQAVYFHNDELGNTLALTDGTGRVIERYDYRDYGLPQFLDNRGDVLTDSTGQPATSSPVGNPFLFHGMEWDPEIGLYHEPAAKTVNPLYQGSGTVTDNPLYKGNSRLYVGNLSWGTSTDHYDPNIGRYVTRGSGNNDNWDFIGGGTLRSFAGDNPWSQRRGQSTRDSDGLVFNVVNPRAAREKIDVLFNPKEYTIKKVTVRGWNPEKKEAITGGLKKEEGGRHTPFHNKYRPQFYMRTTDVTGEIDLPSGREMTTGLDVEYRLYGPGAAHWGQAKFTSACTLGGSKELQLWWQDAAKGKNIRKNITINLRTHQRGSGVRGHRDVGGYRSALIVPIAMEKELRFSARTSPVDRSPTTGTLELIIK